MWIFRFSPQKHGFSVDFALDHFWEGHASKDVAATEPANAAGSEGSFSRLTHAAEFYASQAATQAAGLFSYKKTGDEKSQEQKPGGTILPEFCHLIEQVVLNMLKFHSFSHHR